MLTIILNVFDMVCKVYFNLQYQNCYIEHLHSSLNLIHRSCMSLRYQESRHHNCVHVSFNYVTLSNFQLHTIFL